MYCSGQYIRLNTSDGLKKYFKSDVVLKAGCQQIIKQICFKLLNILLINFYLIKNITNILQGSFKYFNIFLYHYLESFV